MQFLNFEADVQTCNTKQMVQLVMVRLEQNMLGGGQNKNKKNYSDLPPCFDLRWRPGRPWWRHARRSFNHGGVGRRIDVLWSVCGVGHYFSGTLVAISRLDDVRRRRQRGHLDNGTLLLLPFRVKDAEIWEVLAEQPASGEEELWIDSPYRLLTPKLSW